MYNQQGNFDTWSVMWIYCDQKNWEFQAAIHLLSTLSDLNFIYWSNVVQYVFLI